MTYQRTRAASLVLLLLASTLPLVALAGAQDIEDTGVIHAASTPIAEATGPIGPIVAPTNGAPAFALQGGSLRIEVDPSVQATSIGSAAGQAIRLSPSYGEGASADLMATGTGQPEPSELWEGPYARQVLAYTLTIPETLAPGLYDIEAPLLNDEARRALRVYEAWPAEPEIVLVADTQTGDPRALEDGFKESTGIDPLAPHETDPGELVIPPDLGPFNEAMDKTLGIDVLTLEIDPADRWAAYRAAIEQINALAPDLVLFSGDLNFGQLIPSSYHVEYEEAWALINGGTGVDGTVYEGFHVPTLLSPGNHDAYVANGEDGLAYWEATFGPPAYRTTFSNTTLISINTYDWSELDRTGASYAVSAWGGQVRDPQLAWLRTALCEAGGGSPTEDAQALAGVGCTGATDERIVTFSHHSPSWIQDPWEAQYDGAYGQCPCQGTPGLEQAARGVITFTTTDQAWSGENRLELRETLREFEVDLHAAGHTHRDRIARDLGNGTIVETAQLARPGLPMDQLHTVLPNGSAWLPNQTHAFELMRTGQGPLYVETTTTASGTDQYWGYKPVVWHTGPAAMPEAALGIAPFEMGYPMTEDLLEQIARVPGNWNASHAELGLFSTPTYLPSASS